MIGRLLLALTICAGFGGPAAAASVRLFSYDPADEATRNATGPVTLQFRQGLVHVTVTDLKSTEVDATTELRHVPDSTLGAGGLARVLGKENAWRDLYAVSDADQGAALVQALCQSAGRGWLAIGRPRYGSDLAIYVIGAGQNGQPRLCRTLNFTFHGEWRVPQNGTFDKSLLDHSTEGPRS